MQHSLRWLMSVFALLLAVGASLYAVSRILQPEPPPPARRVPWIGLRRWPASRMRVSTVRRAPGDWSFPPTTVLTRTRAPRRGTSPLTCATIVATISGCSLRCFASDLFPPTRREFESAWTPRELYRGHVTLVGGTEERAAGEERFNRAVLGLAGHDAARRQVWLDNWSIDYGRRCSAGTS